jgi:hypothetical protein
MSKIENSMKNLNINNNNNNEKSNQPNIAMDINHNLINTSVNGEEKIEKQDSSTSSAGANLVKCK